MKSYAVVLSGVMLVLSLGLLAHAEELTGSQIIDKVLERERPTDSIITAKMILINSRDEKRTRKVEMKIKEQNDLTKSLIRFIEPADVKGTTFLVREQKDADDEQLLYLPALKKIKRISSSQKTKSFMGTDFSYEDMESKDVDKEGTHNLLRKETVDGHECYVVESIKPEDSDSQYSKIINWIRKDIWIPAKGEFYDKKGKLLKRYEVKNVEKIDGIWTIKLSAMENVQDDHKTVLMLDKIENNVGLSDDVFTERYMQEP